MGAHSFEDVIYTTASAEDAYRQLVDQALHEFGHEPYNGTISTTSGVIAVPSQPLTLAEANKVINQRLDGLDKWGACEALPLVEETPEEWEVTGTHEVSVTLTRAVLSDPKRVTAAIAKQIGAKAKDIKIVSQYPTATTYTYAAQTGEGKAVTRYFVVPAGGTMPKWDDGYASMAEARAAIRDGSAFPSFSRGDIEVEVIAMTRREGGGGMLTGKRSVKTQTLQCRVQTRRLIAPATVGTTRAGWIFYGWAAS